MADQQSDSIDALFAKYLHQGEDLCVKAIDFFTVTYEAEGITAESATCKAIRGLEILCSNFKYTNGNLVKLQAKAKRLRDEADQQAQRARKILSGRNRSGRRKRKDDENHWSWW